VPDQFTRRRVAAPDDDAPRAWRLPGLGLLSASAGVVGRRPLDYAGGLVAFGLASFALVNALYLQKGPHPAPLLAASLPIAPAREATGSLPAVQPTRVADVQPASRPEPEPVRTRAQLNTEIQRELARRGFYDAPIDGIFGAKMDHAIREFEQAAGMRATGEPSDMLLKAIARSTLKAERAKPAPAPNANRETAKPAAPSSRRVVAVQRALTDFGYGPIKLSGVVDAATRTAIEKFERERKLPVKGQLSDRLLRELAAVTGRPLE
jgi:peptidoglycan hydrolase-like protein with peptidoglycan-binding domain